MTARWHLPCAPGLALAAILVTGCASHVPYPADWSPVLRDDAICEALTGSFINEPVESTGTARRHALKLTEVFFGDLLEGFDVTHLRFEVVDDGKLRIAPWVGTVELRETRVLDAAAGGCDAGGWALDSGWEGDGYSTATAAFMTLGMLMPLAYKVEFRLRADTDGQLVLHARQHSLNTAALLLPFPTRDWEDWFVYGHYAAESADERD